MKFYYISDRVSTIASKFCQDKVSSILMELGTRHDNHHVGTGMGGNLSQLLCLMDKRHILSGDPKNTFRVDYDNQEVIWGCRWVQDSKRIDLRNKLNEVLGASPPSYKKNDDLEIASNACKALAEELDAGITSNITSTGELLGNFPMEVILLSIRSYIQIDRLVKYNLDEHPAWRSLLNRVNKSTSNE